MALILIYDLNLNFKKCISGIIFIFSKPDDKVYFVGYKLRCKVWKSFRVGHFDKILENFKAKNFQSSWFFKQSRNYKVTRCDSYEGQ